MSLVMKPLIIKEESKQDAAQDASSLKIPNSADSQMSVQSNSNTLQLQNSAPTSTSLNTAFSNTSQQAYISGQQTSLSGTIGNALGVKNNLNLSSNITTPSLKQQKSFNPTETYLTNYSTPPLNPTSGPINAIVDGNKSRLSSNNLGSSSLLSSFIAPNKSSLNCNTQSVISAPNNTSTQAIPQLNTIGETADISNFTNHIFSQPYLFYQSSNMNIPQLEASLDDLYTVFTFIVPNKPYPSTSTNSQLQKNTSNIICNNSNPSQSLNGSLGSTISNTNSITQNLVSNNNQKNNGVYTSYNSSNNLSSISSNSNTPVTQHSSIPNQTSLNSSKNRISPNGNQNYGEGSTVKQNKNSLNSNATAPKVPHFGLSGKIKEEKKQTHKSQSLVELIKQQCNPEEEKRQKSDSISTINNLNSGFKSSFASQNNLGSHTQLPLSNLSQCSITSLLNLSLNPNSYIQNPTQSAFNPSNSINNSSSVQSNQNTSSISQELEKEDSLLKLQKQTKQELIKQENDESKQESQSQINTMNDEDEEKVVMPDSIDEENNDFNREGDGNSKKSAEDSIDEEDEEARLIREIKEMKRRKSGGQSMFSKNFKKDGGFLFGEEDQDGDIFDFCEENLSGGSKKQKKNGNSNHKNKFDTKNLVKNFLNSFISFVHHPEEESVIIDVLQLENGPQLNDFRSNLRNFFKGKKFNRVLLKEFIFEDLFRPLFLFFLENRALNWIESGRMKDKASHLRALKNFIFVCQNYDQIKSWRFRYNFVSN